MKEGDLLKQAREIVLGAKSIADDVKRLAEPFNIDEMIKKGLIEKDGAWYKINDMEALPEGFKGFIKMSEPTKEGDAVRVKLHSKSKFEKLAKGFAKMGY